MKFALSYCLDHLGFQHEVFDVALGNDHSLLSGKALGLTDLEKTFYFLVHSPNWLYLTPLIYRSGNGYTLLNG